MSISQFEEAPVMHRGNLAKETDAMSQNLIIHNMFGVIIFMWLSTFSFLVMAAVWVLLRLQDPKRKKAPGINIMEL